MDYFLVRFAQTIDPAQVGIPVISGDQILQNGLNIAYFVAGIIAVIVIIVGALNYVTSSGDSAALTRAKGLILYAVVGLVIIIMAFGVTNFVIGRF